MFGDNLIGLAADHCDGQTPAADVMSVAVRYQSCRGTEIRGQ
ncbi:hypothetical protein GFS60_07903 (plasmid) [Rhodococcus sp. WAY2]|nr:hypothetical protein GFS60_07903 [Rhodococcus sp. WAY2]